MTVQIEVNDIWRLEWIGLDDGLDEEEGQEWRPEYWNGQDEEQVEGDYWKFHLVLIKFEIAYETCQWCSQAVAFVWALNPF